MLRLKPDTEEVNTSTPINKHNRKRSTLGCEWMARSCLDKVLDERRRLDHAQVDVVCGKIGRWVLRGVSEEGNAYAGGVSNAMGALNAVVGSSRGKGVVTLPSERDQDHRAQPL